MPYMYGNLSAVAIGRGPRRCLFECLKNILLDFKNGHNRFITSVGPYGAYQCAHLGTFLSIKWIDPVVFYQIQYGRTAVVHGFHVVKGDDGMGQILPR